MVTTGSTTLGTMSAVNGTCCPTVPITAGPTADWEPLRPDAGAQTRAASPQACQVSISIQALTRLLSRSGYSRSV